ncbi:Pyruvate kinase [Frankliniella fusca]|uniref:Pyruvate kinase n=1 Tax=Frankliniella fusca TaxID=407009 RepID=A0AAE1GVG2_9NEOP|nr:Pyruvate kinase [Frankliniella fusca]
MSHFVMRCFYLLQTSPPQHPRPWMTTRTTTWAAS